VESRPDLIVHLAAIVSGEAEADFEKGYRVNLDGTRELFEAVRLVGDGYRPRLVFTSSIAVFGAPFPATASTTSSTRRRSRATARRRPWESSCSRLLAARLL
jgi:nucleoside-diphosphate-sugar epimerase